MIGALVNHNVSGCHIAMQNAVQVSEFEGCGHFLQQWDHLIQRQSAARHVVNAKITLQSDPRDVLHDLKHAEPIVMSKIVQSTDVLVMQRLDPPIRSREIVDQLFRSSKLGLEELQHDFAGATVVFSLRINCQPCFTEAADPQHPLQHEPTHKLRGSSIGITCSVQKLTHLWPLTYFQGRFRQSTEFCGKNLPTGCASLRAAVRLPAGVGNVVFLQDRSRAETQAAKGPT